LRVLFPGLAPWALLRRAFGAPDYPGSKKHAALGVPVQVTRYDGMMHGFFTMAAMIDQGRKAVQQAAAALGTAFAS
jgi:acetyl esterase/lipase